MVLFCGARALALNAELKMQLACKSAQLAETKRDHEDLADQLRATCARFAALPSKVLQISIFFDMPGWCCFVEREPWP